MGDSSPQTDINVMEHLVVKDDHDPQGLVNTITEDTQSVPHSFEYKAGAMNELQQAVAEAVRSEMAFFAQKDKEVDTVSLNYSGQVRFRTYSITPAMGAIRCLDDKPFRGDSVITVQTGGPVYIGGSADIQSGSLNTILVTGSRTIRTAHELWAICTVACVFDVQEEFN